MATPLRVLMIEDSSDDTALAVRSLRRGGYKVEFAQVDTLAGTEQAIAEQEWDIVIADHSLPQFSAPEALEYLRARGLDLPFIILSGTITEEIAVMAMKSGAQDFVMKDHLARLAPVVARELREAQIRREHLRVQDLNLRLVKIYDTSANEIYVFEPTCLRLVQVNQTARRNLGYTLDELQRMSVLDLLPELDFAFATQSIEPLLIGEQEELTFETVIRRKDGSVYPIEAHLYPSPEEHTPLFVAIVTDITARKRAESALRNSQEAERQRIANELQDTFLRELVMTIQALQVAQARCVGTPVAGELSRTVANIQQLAHTLSDTIYNLHPAVPARTPSPLQELGRDI